MLGTSQTYPGPYGKRLLFTGCFKLQALLLSISDDPTKFREASARSVAIYNPLIGVLTGLNLRPVLPAYYSTVVTCQGFLERVLHTRDTGGQDPSQAFLQMARK